MFTKIKGFGQYSINKQGQVRNDKTQKILKQTLVHGYPTVKVRDNDGAYKSRRVHRLLAIAFIPNPDQKPHINHINGIKNDNRLCNLEWCTPQENIDHSMDVLGNRQTMGKKIRKTRLAKKTVTIYDWKIGNKKYRVMLSIGKTKMKTIGYYTTYSEAYDAWVKAYTNHYGISPITKEL